MRSAMIITNEVRDHVAALESLTDPQAPEARLHTSVLVGAVVARCALPEVRQRYEAYRETPGTVGPYPLDREGYAVGYDPLEDEAGFYETWQKYGVVVGRTVVDAALCDQSVESIKQTVSTLSDGRCDLDQPESYAHLPQDDRGVPILTRGFFEVYHDDALAQLRQAVRVYLQHVVIWGRADIWTTFDRYGVKLPGHEESKALPLHVDQNPKEHPDFRTTQGVLALEDCPAERGTFVAVPGSRSVFEDYLPMAPGRGEYVELDTAAPVAERLAARAQALPLRKGDLVTWDSRTTHANTANVSASSRFVALISAGLSRSHDPAAVAARREAYASGLGSNVRSALMHASKKPRYTDPDALARVRRPERLSPLGRLLYGWDSYES